MQHIGILIKTLRKQRGLTQAELAARFGMSRATISGIERGSVAEIGIRKVEAILNFFGYTLAAKPLSKRPTLEQLEEESWHG